MIEERSSAMVLAWCCYTLSEECACAVSGREALARVRSEERECRQDKTAFSCACSLLFGRLATQACEFRACFELLAALLRLFFVSLLLRLLAPLHKSSFFPPSFPPQPQPPNTYNGSYQADGSQVHGRQSPAQAARHQGCPQVGARHRCVFCCCLNELSRPSAPPCLSRNGPVLSAGSESGSQSTRLARERGEATAGSDRASAAKMTKRSKREAEIRESEQELKRRRRELLFLLSSL